MILKIYRSKRQVETKITSSKLVGPWVDDYLEDPKVTKVEVIK